jgi:hypothetical protein
MENNPELEKAEIELEKELREERKVCSAFYKITQRILLVTRGS